MWCSVVRHDMVNALIAPPGHQHYVQMLEKPHGLDRPKGGPKSSRPPRVPKKDRRSEDMKAVLDKAHALPVRSMLALPAPPPAIGEPVGEPDGEGADPTVAPAALAAAIATASAVKTMAVRADVSPTTDAIVVDSSKCLAILPYH